MWNDLLSLLNSLNSTEAFTMLHLGSTVLGYIGLALSLYSRKPSIVILRASLTGIAVSVIGSSVGYYLVELFWQNHHFGERGPITTMYLLTTVVSVLYYGSSAICCFTNPLARKYVIVLQFVVGPASALLNFLPLARAGYPFGTFLAQQQALMPFMLLWLFLNNLRNTQPSPA